MAGSGRARGGHAPQAAAEFEAAAAREHQVEQDERGRVARVEGEA